MKKGLRLFLFGVVLSLVALIALAYQQTSWYLHPTRTAPPSGERLVEAGIEYEEIELLTEDGLRLQGWYTPPQNGVVIVMAHGYGGVRPIDFYLLFAEQGYGVVTWDARAHGDSDGEVTTLGYAESRDVEVALEFALARPETEHVGAWGGSMGAVSVLLAAARRPEIEAIIADSPFPSLEDELKDQISPALWRELIRFFAELETGTSIDLVRPIDVIDEISPRPVFIIQGMSDTRIPVDAAQRLYDAAGEPRWIWTEETPPHMNMYAFYKTRYTKRTAKFFREFLLGQ